MSRLLSKHNRLLGAFAGWGAALPIICVLFFALMSLRGETRMSDPAGTASPAPPGLARATSAESQVRFSGAMVPAVRQFLADPATGGKFAVLHVATSPSGFLTWIGFASDHPLAVAGVQAAAKPEDAALAFAAARKSLFQNESPQSAFAVKKVQENGGSHFTRLAQKFGELPVFGAEIIVQTDANNLVRSVVSDILTDTGDLDAGRLSLKPDIASPAAAGLAVGILADAVATEANAAGHDTPSAAAPSAFHAGVPDLEIYGPAVLGNKGPVRLVWRMEVQNAADPRLSELVLLDAHDGTVPYHYRLVRDAKDRHIEDLHSSTVRNENDPVTGNWYVDTAYSPVGVAYDFYAATTGRDGMYYEGQTINVQVRADDWNAWYSPDTHWLHFGWDWESGRNFCATDVVGHEYTHGVIDSMTGLLGTGESGALHEGISDVWGEWIEQSDTTYTPPSNWLMGEDIDGGQYLRSGPFRNLANPPAINDPNVDDIPNPDRYHQPQYWDTVYNPQSWRPDAHHNAGPIGKLGYLLTYGDTFNHYPIIGFGKGGMAVVFYFALYHLSSAADYHGFYHALIQGAEDAGCTPTMMLNVERACQSVNIRDTPPGGVFCKNTDDSVAAQIDDSGTARTRSAIEVNHPVGTAIPNALVLFRNNQNQIVGGITPGPSGTLHVSGELRVDTIPDNTANRIVRIRYQGVGVTTLDESGNLEIWGDSLEFGE